LPFGARPGKKKISPTVAENLAPTILSTCSRENSIYRTMIEASLIISGLSLGVSVTTFGWLHLRKIDAVVCGLVSSGIEKQSTFFQFSLANLGARSILIISVHVIIYINPALNGKFMADCTPTGDKLPQVIRPGEILSTTVRSNWSISFVCEAGKEAEKRAEENASLFFVASVVAWNPKGKQMTGSKQVAFLEADTKSVLSRFQSGQGAFKLRKA
jgi:hypothetical protein